MSSSRVDRPVIPALTFRGWALLTGALAALVVAYVAGWRELLFVGFTLLAVVVFAVVVVVLRSARIEVTRTLSETTVPSGTEVRVTLDLQNPSPFPLSGVDWADVVPAEVGASSGGRLPALAARGYASSRVRLQYTLTAARRGLVQVGPLALRTTDPFGICRVDGTVGPVEQLVVLPEIAVLEGSVRSAGGVAESAVRAVLAGRGQDDVIAREYRQGDALRHVHWRATAHRGELMVRQEQQEDEAAAVVVLDNRREAWRSTAAFEWAVSFAASVVVHLAAGPTGVALVTTAPDPEVDEGAKDRPLDDVLLQLATVTRRRPHQAGPAGLRALDRLVGDTGASIVAVVGHLDDAEWHDIVSRRGARAAGAGVFVDAERIPEAAWAQGWSIAEVEDPASDKSSVWRAVSGGVRG